MLAGSRFLPPLQGRGGVLHMDYDQLVALHNVQLHPSRGDLFEFTMQLPEGNLTEVRVVRPGLGTIVTADHCEEVNVELGITDFLSRVDAEHLIRLGSLQQLDGERRPN